jgi:hypothetical protein
VLLQFSPDLFSRLALLFSSFIPESLNTGLGARTLAFLYGLCLFGGVGGWGTAGSSAGVPVFLVQIFGAEADLQLCIF